MASQKKPSSRPPKRKARTGRESDAGSLRETAGPRAVVYEVELRQEQLTGYRPLLTTDGNSRRGTCHEALWGSVQPCPGCPVLAFGRATIGRRDSSVMATTAPGYRIAVAEALGAGRFRVVQLQLGESVVTALQRARIDRMARRAKLSRRELAVLDLVLLGRTSGDVAKALGITERTARFHVGNIFTKLQAESRSDLLRLLL